ncbi:hypothetical protein MU439_00430 [Methanonatronarchaeum sp. AMET6-2]|nr:hypothetical protein [Methanonatronarchaeum sp. AMET6-2]UOY10141.1 hypothetical protein MU439_00430 [Methanonatronarchaeum sp. AMET6-2]
MAYASYRDSAETHDFEFVKYGDENHADYNVGENIGLRYLRQNQTGSGGGAPVGMRLNSGMLNTNRGISPASTEARAGVHAESPRLQSWVADIYNQHP